MKKYWIFSALFLLMLTVPALWMLLQPDKSFSENENRYLQQRPALNADAVTSGKFQKQTEKWLSEQFPGRDLLMGAGTLMKKAVGYRDVGGAWIGKEGYYLEKHTPEDFDWKKYRRSLGYLADLAEASGLPAKALLIPCAASAMPEKLPGGAETYDTAAALRAAREVMPDVTVPDLTTLLRAHPETQLYYRTDHHWTAAGARLGYDYLMNGEGAYTGTPTVFCDDFYGTTFSKTLDPMARPDTVSLFPLPDTVTAVADGEEIPVYDLSAGDRKDKYTVFLGGNHGLVTLTGGCENGRTLLVLKDSFANCLAPLLTADYETVLLVDLRYYPGSVRSLLSMADPDELLFVYEMNNLASDDDFVKLLLP